MNNPIVSLSEMERMAAAIAKSGLYGMKTPDQALALMVVAQSEGRHPGSIAAEYNIIQGRPALKADAMLARFQDAGGSVEWHDYTDAKVSATFSHPKGGTVTVDWDMARAAAAKLTGKDNWRTYPRAMLRSRVISEGVRTCYPAVCVGVYTPEEVQDFSPEKDITPTAGAEDRLSSQQIEDTKLVVDKVAAWLNEGKLADAVVEMDNAGMDADEHTYFWTFFGSKDRRAMKEEIIRQSEARKQIKAKPISEAQRKRLEARISELGLDRDAVKADCMKRFGKEHFSELTKDEYDIIDGQLNPAPSQASQSPPSPVGEPADGAEPKAAAAQVSPETAARNGAAVNSDAGNSPVSAAAPDVCPECKHGNRINGEIVHASNCARKRLADAGSMGALAKAWSDIGTDARARLEAFKDECKARIMKADKEAIT